MEFLEILNHLCDYDLNQSYLTFFNLINFLSFLKTKTFFHHFFQELVILIKMTKLLIISIFSIITNLFIITMLLFMFQMGTTTVSDLNIPAVQLFY